MAPKLHKINVIDLEATCWEGAPPGDEVQEIIEIGICTLYPLTGDIEDKRSIFVKPVQSRVSEFCTELTGITPEMVEDGCTLREALGTLNVEYHVNRHPWASWGAWDRDMFQRAAKQINYVYPFGKVPYGDWHIDIKVLFGLYYGYKNAPGLKRAYKQVDFEMEGEHHRGDDDAYNAAKLLRTCIGKGLV